MLYTGAYSRYIAILDGNRKRKSQIHVTWPLQSQICWWSMTMAWLVRFRLFSARVLASFDPSAPSKSPASLIKLIKWYQNMLILYIKTHLSILHMQKDSYVSKSLLRKTSSCLVGGVIPSVVLHLEELLLQNGLLSLGALQHMLVHFFCSARSPAKLCRQVEGNNKMQKHLHGDEIKSHQQIPTNWKLQLWQISLNSDVDFYAPNHALSWLSFLTSSHCADKAFQVSSIFLLQSPRS